MPAMPADPPRPAEAAGCDCFADSFNHRGPYQVLGDVTPAEYLRRRSQETAPRLICPEPGHTP
jgi:hypothetical protein